MSAGEDALAGLGEPCRDDLCDLAVDEARDLTSALRLVISARSRSISVTDGVAATAEMDGAATSIILSASCARSLRDTVAPVEAKTMRTLVGKHWRNSSRTRESSMRLSPINCCIRRSNCVGFRSPSSSAFSSNCSLFCSDAAVRPISCPFSVSYGFSSGGVSMRSRTSVAILGAKEATTWSYLVFCEVIRRVAN